MESEFPKWLKIVLIINTVLAFCFGIVYIIDPALVLWNEPVVPYALLAFVRATGMEFCVLGVFNLLLIRINDWDKCKLYFEFLVVYSLLSIITNILAFNVLGLVIMGGLGSIYLYYYYQQTKK